jgi:hypothetical protein
MQIKIKCKFTKLTFVIDIQDETTTTIKQLCDDVIAKLTANNLNNLDNPYNSGIFIIQHHDTNNTEISFDANKDDVKSLTLSSAGIKSRMVLQFNETTIGMASGAASAASSVAATTSKNSSHNAQSFVNNGVIKYMRENRDELDKLLKLPQGYNLIRMIVKNPKILDTFNSNITNISNSESNSIVDAMSDEKCDEDSNYHYESENDNKDNEYNVRAPIKQSLPMKLIDDSNNSNNSNNNSYMLFRQHLTQLHDLGFTDDTSNRNMLTMTNGDIDAAINLLLSAD